MTTYLITGANGFVGRAACTWLTTLGLNIRGTVKAPQSLNIPANIEVYYSGDIYEDTNWREALSGIDAVIHLAATVHRPDIKDTQIYQSTITAATTALAQQAVEVGVKRLVYVSSSHVYGIETSSTPISEAHPKAPLTPYGQAKSEAEDMLQKMASQSNLEVVIVRPPLIYGAGVRNNFVNLLRLVQKLPVLPFGCATQKRSFVGIDNFIRFLHLCATHEHAANRIFNISDNHDLSTKELCEIFTALIGKKRVLLPIPTAFMRSCCKAAGKESLYSKLFEPVRLDVSQAKSILEWEPEFTPLQQLQRMLALSPT